MSDRERIKELRAAIEGQRWAGIAREALDGWERALETIDAMAASEPDRALTVAYDERDEARDLVRRLVLLNGDEATDAMIEAEAKLREWGPMQNDSEAQVWPSGAEK